MLFSETILAKLRRNEPSYGKEIDLAGKLDDLQQGKIEALGVAVAGINQALAITYDVTTGAADIKLYDGIAPFKFEIIDVIIQSRGTDGTGTLKITNGTNDITDAITCAVDKAMDRAATIDNDYSTIAKDGTVQIVCAGGTVANVKALVTLVVIAID